MITIVQKWGNSQGLRLSKELLSGVDIQVGDAGEVMVHEDSIGISPVQRMRGRHNLIELVQDIPEDYEPRELEWGDPVGREVWKVAGYIQRKGESIVLTLDPQYGHEQRRP